MSVRRSAALRPLALSAALAFTGATVSHPLPAVLPEPSRQERQLEWHAGLGLPVNRAQRRARKHHRSRIQA